ncbi:MAG TPA: class I SAM-dependent methyltransferase [Longimicrobiales bacterium]|nr:class I SAM-dependent methyltransferase [Longimicrobiales bacterium]
MTDGFWEQPDVVDMFAARDPDHRLVRLVTEYGHPDRVRVLDLGCAGGRNTVFLAKHGFDVHAIDTSAAMVTRTRERVATVLGWSEAVNRVRVGAMDDLARFDDASFDLVVALGVYHNARTMQEWDAAIAGTARVLEPAGRLLLNQFTPDVDLTGAGVHPVDGQPGVYDGMPDGRAVLMDADDLDRAIARHGLLPVVPSETVRVETEDGRRVSVNALYLRQPYSNRR